MSPLRIRPVVPIQLFKPRVTPATPPVSTLVLRCPTTSGFQADTRNFLDLGHANPCWCGTHANSGALEENKYTTLESLHTPSTQLEMAVDDVDASCVPLPPDSDSHDSSLQAPYPSSDAASVLSDDWTVLPFSSQDRGQRSRSISSCESMEDDEGTSLISPASYVTSRLSTPRPSPEDSMSESNSGRSSPSLWIRSPSDSSLEFLRSPWEDGECQVCEKSICVCDTASTSAVEWPVLLDDKGMKKKRHELRGGTYYKDHEERIWELDCDWFM
ncbi:hypothetical protein NX059_006270 [Plenodomus lindquistii]|nr:hypothetical protein NX059_006270 [Plenodomus lindquistii]